MRMHYYNLSNGLKFKEYRLPHALLRIQSTACEQKRWNFILQDLDNSFLYNLAVGNICVVYDLSEKKQETRSLYQGLEWIKFALTRRWFARDYQPKVRGHNCFNYFDEEYSKLEYRTKKKIDYFIQFLRCSAISLEKVAGNLKEVQAC